MEGSGRKVHSIDRAWEILFERHSILSRVEADGMFAITSAEINTVKEARLMAKFDQSSQLPAIFQANKLSILPVTRGEYRIGHFRTHQPIRYPAIRPTPIPDPGLETLDAANLYSEAAALLFAHNSGIIRDMLGASQVAYTVNGRMSSGEFSCRIQDSLSPERLHSLHIKNAQVEIDAGYETADAFCICEAKNMAAQELLIRQLYYPWRLWTGKLAKPVIPVFLVYSNDVFHLFRYGFEDETLYNSIRLLEHRAYTFAQDAISLSDIAEAWKSAQLRPEPAHPFPQANSFERVVDLLSILMEAPLSRNEVTLQYEFDPRQTDYYISACEYLGLVTRQTSPTGERVYALTPDAVAILSQGHREKYLALIRRMLEYPVFHDCFGLLLRTDHPPDIGAIRQSMEAHGLAIGEGTMNRRASTVRNWFNWILNTVRSDEQMRLF
ncbi:hypothetical protein LJC63_12365 [Ruminococcaceae bacterium OttesenSCG-928-L11]|nr:hypothetical protein [Ruminococcaceae bacterium OttesenSCG-928-L11]